MPDAPMFPTSKVLTGDDLCQIFLALGLLIAQQKTKVASLFC